MQINRSDVVAEVGAAFADYEQALLDGDTARIVGHFWDSPHTLRYGLADHQLSGDEHRAWRAGQSALPAGRRLFDTRITTFGTDAAVVNTFFDYPDGTAGRQSQTWIRQPDGWRIVSAHVSRGGGR